MTDTVSTERETRAALDVARSLARAGVPIFTAPPDAAHPVGFRLPNAWQHLEPDPAAVDRWRPGMALCAVMGRGIDLVDIDPRHGGDLNELGVPVPRHYASAATPSGGAHLFVAPLGVGSRDKVAPGIDVKAGEPDGNGRGFAFLAPTVKPSKVTGELAAYRWVESPDLEALRGAWTRGDTSGAPLAALVRERRATTSSPKALGGPEWWQQFRLNTEPQSALAAQRAVTTKLADVEGWTPEHPDNFRIVLIRAAVTLGGYVGGGWLTEGDARERLETAVAAVWGTPDANDLLWIEQGIRDGAAKPFYVYTPEDEALYGEQAQQRQSEGEATPADVALVLTEPVRARLYRTRGVFDPAGAASDQDLAQAGISYLYNELRYASDLGFWLRNEGSVWGTARGSFAKWAVGVLHDLMPPGETPVPKDPTERTEGHWQAWRRREISSDAGANRLAGKINALVLADHPASLRIADLDTNPEVFWAGGTAWDLAASGDIPTPASWVHPSTPHLHTALCAPDPTVPTPRWDRFLAAVLPDPEVRSWALRVLSIALTGHPDAALPVLYGRERSGKSSLVEMMVELLGTYGQAVSTSLVSGRNAPSPFDLYDLKGLRLAFVDEGPGGSNDATERLKQITGGTSLRGAPKFGNQVSFRPTHTLVMTSNKEPSLTDPALRARLRVIPCDAPEEEVQPARLPLLGPGLRAEAPGILAALMRETAAWLADRSSTSNLLAPESVRSLVGEIAAGQDPVREWMETCTVSEGWTRATELRTAFGDFHQAHPSYKRSSVPTPTAFGRALRDLGVPSEHRRDGTYWQLSVIGGPGGPGQGTLTPHAFMGATPPRPNANTAPPNDNVVTGPWGQWQVGDGTAGPPVTPDNAWSPPLFSSSVTGVIDKESKGGIEREEGIYREKGGEVVAPPVTVTDDLREGEKLAPTCDDASVMGAAPPITPSTAPAEHFGPRPGTAPTPPPPRNVSKRETAAKAHEDKISKAEARRALAEEKRRAAVAEVGGEVHPLPAIVDRAGHVIPCTIEQARAVVVTAIERTGALTVDVETSGYPVGHREFTLRSVQLGGADAAVVLDPRPESEGGHADAIRLLLADAPRLHAHSATADLVPLAHAGLIDIESGWDRMYDTVIPAKLVDPAITGSDPGLKQLAGTLLGDQATAPASEEARTALFKAGGWLTNPKTDTAVARNGWAQVPTGCEVMLRYAASDVLDTAAIAQKLFPPLNPEGNR